jgi:two-component system nitrogen regulation response regulator GlnG
MLTETTERIDFPAYRVEEDAWNFPLRPRKFPRVRVLVVDDEPLIRWSCAETLGDSGFQVIEVDNGAAALFALTHPNAGADVVLLDLMLPDFCDLSLLAVMRRLAPEVPIVVMTAFATSEIVERARRFGAFAVITKPFEMEELAPLLRRALRGGPLG